MIGEEPKQALDTPLLAQDTTLGFYKLPLSNIVYQVNVAMDGDSWCAMIGQSLQDGITGYGTTVAEALHDLASNITPK